MSEIVIPGDLSKAREEKLKLFHAKILRTIPNENLAFGIQYHPDLLIHPLPNGSLVVDRDHFQQYRKIFPKREIYPSFYSLNKEYPQDTILNGVSFSHYFIHKLSCTDPQVLDYYRNCHYECINVNQGYTKCNLLFGKDYFLTSDLSVYSAMKEIATVYLIAHKQIILSQFPYGFIGGCSGRIKNQLILTGRFSHRGDRDFIQSIFQKHGEDIYYLSEEKLEDIGSIFYLSDA